MFGIVTSFAFTFTTFGSFMNFSAMRRIGVGIVAENKSVWWFSGTFDKIFSMSSMNPIFNISSASSKITV